MHSTENKQFNQYMYSDKSSTALKWQWVLYCRKHQLLNHKYFESVVVNQRKTKTKALLCPREHLRSICTLTAYHSKR